MDDSQNQRTQYDYAIVDVRDGTDPIGWLPGAGGETPVGNQAKKPYNTFEDVRERYDNKIHYIGRYKGNEEIGIKPFVGPLVRGTGLLVVPRNSDNPALSEGYEVLAVPGQLSPTKVVCWTQIQKGQVLPQNRVPSGIRRDSSFVFIGKRSDVGVGMVCMDNASRTWKFFSSTGSIHDEFEILCRVR